MTWRRAVASAVALAVAGAVAGSPPLKPYFGATAIADAAEVRVFRLDGAPVLVPVPAGQRRLRVLVNLDLPADARAGRPFVLALGLPEEGRRERFPMLAVPARTAAGLPALFYLGAAEAPALTREIVLERAGDGPASLEVSLEDGLRGALRVLGTRDLAHLALPVADDPSVPDAEPAPRRRRWTRLPAAAGTQTRRMYFKGRPVPVAPPAVEPAPARPLAFTVRGPGVLRLRSAEPLEQRATLRLESGAERATAVSLAAGEHFDLAIPDGLASLSLAAAPASLTASVSLASMALSDDEVWPRADGGLALAPSMLRASAARLAPPPAAPVRFRLAGRGERELQLAFRGEGAGPRRVSWRLRDGQGRVLGEGAQPLARGVEAGAAAPGGAALQQATTRVLWPPAAAAVLELACDGPAWVTAASPAFEPAPPEPPRPMRLRHARQAHPAWLAVEPDEPAQLLREGRWGSLRLPVELEPAPAAAPARAVRLVPRGDPLALELLQPSAKGSVFPLRAAVDEALQVRGATAAETHAGLTLYWLRQPRAEAAELTARVDGAKVLETPLYASRGRLSLPPVAVGAHRLQVDVSQPARLLVDQPVAAGAAAALRRLEAFELPAGESLTVPTGAGPTSVGVVLYFEKPPPDGAALELAVLGGRPAAPFTALRTRRTRALPLQTHRADAVCLTRDCPTLAESAPLAVQLGDDLGAGPHRLKLRLRNAGSAWVRLYAHPLALPADGAAAEDDP